MAGNRSSSGFIGLLTIAFIVLKLTGYIDWSWWWVLSPVWIACIIAVGIAIAAIVVSWQEYKRPKK